MSPAAYRQAIETWLCAVPLRRTVWELLCRRSEATYLVGGSVRDALLSRPSYDLDFAVDGDALALARQVADATRGAYVPLDRARKVGRVVLRTGRGEQHIDLAGLRAQSILADLCARDLTINAMATRVHAELGELLDPTGGQADLQAGILRAATRSAFSDDPIRVLRTLRLHGSLGFSIAPGTELMMRQWAHKLATVAPERLRDEVYNILGLDDAGRVLRYGQSLGVLESMPAISQQKSVTARGLGVLSTLEGLFGSAGSRSMLWSQAMDHLAPFRERMMSHWDEPLTHGRRRWETLKLAALLTSDTSQEDAWALAKQLKLSNHEGRFLALSTEAARRVSSLSAQGGISPLDIYRTFRLVGDAGLDGCALALAERVQETPAHAADLLDREMLLTNVGRLLRAWYDARSQFVDPPRLLTGGDLVTALGIEQGPCIGHLLEAIREAQVQGLVDTREQALAFASHHGDF